MKWIVVLAAIVAVLMAASMAYVRFAPIDPDRWHTNPAEGVPGRNGYVVKAEGGDEAGPLLAGATAREALERLHGIILETPRTRLLAGGPADGLATYVTRSAFWGFPDFTTVSAEEAEGGARLVIHARQGIGEYDWDVNARRVRGWLAALQG